MSFRSLALVVSISASLVLAGCAPEVADPAPALGTSELAPSFAPEKKQKQAKARAKRSDAPDKRPARSKRARASDSAAPEQGGPASQPSGEARPEAPATLRAAVTDRTGDVSGGLTAAPPYADITAASLTRTGNGYELAMSFAGAVPARQGDDRILNVASFYDLDGDGTVDYEVWATLADNGWSGSYRTPSGARFGANSGVTARPQGQELVVSFPLGHLQGASQLRWAVGAEWGSVEQIASGTTSRDTAPDQGVAAFPG